MQPIDEKIKLYAVRDFGQGLTVVMDFLRQNWKALLLYLTYFLLPLSLIQGLSLNGFMSGYMDLIGGIMTNASDPPMSLLYAGLSLLAYMALYMLGILLMYAVVYGLMRLYERGEGNLSDVSWSDLKPHFMFTLKRTLVLLLIGFAVAFVLVVIVGTVIGLVMYQNPALFASVYMLFVFFMLAVAVLLGPPLSLITPAYVFEDDATLIPAIKRGVRLGFKIWLVAVGVLTILSMIIYMGQQFISLPWGIMMFVKMLFGMGLDGLNSSYVDNVFYSFIYYLTAVIQCFAGFVLSAVPLIGAAFLYGHAAEKVDGMTVSDNIRNFDSL